MSITQDELIRRQQERIGRLESALRLIKSIINGPMRNRDAFNTIEDICYKELEEKE